MTANYNSGKWVVIIRLCNLYNLIFFVLIAGLLSCKQSKHDAIALLWKNNQAVAVSIPKHLLNGAEVDSMNSQLQVRIKKSSINILGEWSSNDDDMLFEPVVPLTGGMSYEIFFRDITIGNVQVPLPDTADATKVVEVYPTADALPENLLKMYIQFSSPMREGESDQHIFLLDDNNDTLPAVFLALQPELWNKERTVLTVWLDPGRIKRELIPNQELGNPLTKGKLYTLIVSDNWKDVQGLPLKQPHSKQFIVGARDSLKPDIEKWMLNLPVAETIQPLTIHFGEPLDYFLLQETIKIVDEKNNVVGGKIEVSNNERRLRFIPNNKWVKGSYRLQVASILEDVAGNNLNRPFDREIGKDLNNDKLVFEKRFEIYP